MKKRGIQVLWMRYDNYFGKKEYRKYQIRGKVYVNTSNISNADPESGTPRTIQGSKVMRNCQGAIAEA